MSETPDILHELLCREEGTRLQAYDDANGHALLPGYTLIGNPTIGTGREIGRHGVSQAENDILLGNDITHVMEQGQSAFEWFGSLDPIRQAIIGAMLFQLGLRNVLGFTHFLEAMAQRDYKAAAACGLASKWAQHDTPERAQREMLALQTGVIVRR